MTKHEADVIGGLNMTDQISNEAYKQIMIAAQDENEPCEDCISRQAAIDTIESWLSCDDYNEAELHIMRAMQSVLYDLPSVNPQKPKSEWQQDHEILKAYSDGASAVLESLIEQYEHYLELLDADMKDGSATIVTKTKYAVYTEVVKQLKEVEVQE